MKLLSLLICLGCTPALNPQFVEVKKDWPTLKKCNDSCLKNKDMEEWAEDLSRCTCLTEEKK